MPERRVFLSAEWRELVMLNYEVKPGMLPGCLRSGVELDSFEGRTFIGSLGFSSRTPSFMNSWRFPSKTISTK